MKRLIFLGAMLIGFSAIAQEKPIISSAVIAIDRNNELDAAKGYIDEAQAIISGKSLSDVREKDLAKFYYYKGLINYRVHISEDPAIKSLDANALDKAVEGFSQLLELEKKNGKERYTSDAKQQLTALSASFANRGIQASQNKDYEGAYTDFLKSYEMKKKFMNSIDTSMYYNAALMAQNMKANEKAIPIYKDLLNMDYHGTRFYAVSVEKGDTMDFASAQQMEMFVTNGQVTNPTIEGDIRPDLYKTVAYLSLAEGDTAGYTKTIQEGRAKFPQNLDLIIAELQLFFDNQEYDKALANLDKAIAADPTNPLMYYNKGVILQNEMKRTNDALAAYEKTLEIDSNYTDALYMTSIIYIDSANAVVAKMNDLPYNATKKYNAYKKQKNEIFKTALPYLEKAYKKNSEDQQVKIALSQVYRSLEMYDKAKAVMGE